MKRYVTAMLALTWLTACCCPGFAVVECKVPQELPGVAAPDVLNIGGAPEDTVSSEELVMDIPADGVFEEQPVDGKYSTMGVLYQAWGGYEGYPDYVCGVWSTDGGLSNMTVAVTNDKAGEKGKQEILSLLKNTDSVTFTYQTYSFGQLMEVNNAIVERMMAGGSPIVSCGVYEMENAVHISILETAENAAELAQELLDQYGEMVVVELGSELIIDTTARENSHHKEYGGVLLVLAAVVILSGLTLARKLPARVTNTGKVVAAHPLTPSQAENLIKEQTETPPDRVEEEIRKQL